MNELRHYGVLGMKWGVRRYQNKDGSLTAAGRARYGVDSTGRNIARAFTNTAVGQRLVVSANKGYREDKKRIKAERDAQEAQNRKIEDASLRKEANKKLANDYKKTLAEARTAAAQAIYRWQSDAANKKIQSQSLAEAVVKSFILGGYGALTFDRLSADGVERGKIINRTVMASIGEMTLAGIPALADYAIGQYESNRNKR